MNTRTRPERNLEKLEHEPEKCDWKTTDTQKMRSIIISAPNENSQKASKSVNVLAAGSQDRICVNEHQN